MSVLKYEEKLKELTELSIEERRHSAAGSTQAFNQYPENPTARREEEARQARIRRDTLVDKLTALANSIKRLKI